MPKDLEIKEKLPIFAGVEYIIMGQLAAKKGNEAFKIKFEKRILNNLGVRWRRMST